MEYNIKGRYIAKYLIKRMRFLFFIIFCMLVTSSREQFVTVSSDPVLEAQSSVQTTLQSSTLSEIMAMLSVAEQGYQTTINMKNQLVYLKTQAENIEQRLHNIQNVNGLNLNEIESFLQRTGCLFGNGYYFLDGRYNNLISMLLNGLLSCNNNELYLTTFAGMRKKMIDQGRYGLPIGYSGNPQYNILQLNQNKSSYQNDLKTASDLNETTSNAYKNNTMDASTRMKSLSISIDSLATKMKGLSSNSENNYSDYERVMLSQKSVELHMLAMDYMNKSYELGKKASELSEADENKLKAYEWDEMVRECMMFRAY